MESRIKTALDFVKDGQSFTIGELRLSVENLNTVIVAGWSQYLNLFNITKVTSLRELSDIKRTFSDMLSASDELKEFAASKSLEYKLFYDDAGKASVEICYEKNGLIEWKIDLK